MKVKYAKVYGFCDGVRRAMDLASATFGSAKKAPVYTLGPLVHNKHVVEGLKENGVFPTTFEEISKAPEGKDIGGVIIRAHGIPLNQQEFLEGRSRNGLCTIIDATCFNIVMQYKLAEQYADKKYSLWIVEGKQASGKIHPEIAAKMSRINGGICRITCAEDIPDGGYYGNIALIPQTTFERKELDRIMEKLKARADDVQLLGDICEATKERQAAAIKLAKTVDAMVVVGGGLEGQPSNNTLELAHVSKGINPRTYLVADATELKKDDFEGVETVGLTAGASTPDDIIKKVEEVLKQF